AFAMIDARQSLPIDTSAPDGETSELWHDTQLSAVSMRRAVSASVPTAPRPPGDSAAPGPDMRRGNVLLPRVVVGRKSPDDDGPPTALAVSHPPRALYPAAAQTNSHAGRVMTRAVRIALTTPRRRGRRTSPRAGSPSMRS